MRVPIQFIISETADHHNQAWPSNLHFKLFLSIDLSNKLVVLWRFYVNITAFVGITAY